MNNAIIGHKLIQLESVDSTNNYTAKVFKSGEVTSGTVIMADIQTDGRGQRKNTWQSLPYENITLSIPLYLKDYPISYPSTINHIVSLGLYDFLMQYCPYTAVKWPNDIVVHHKKIGGILIENHFSGHQLKSCIIGIGINVNQTHFDFKNTTSLKIETKKNYLLKELVHELILCLNQRVHYFLKNGFQSTKKTFDEKLWLKDKISKYQAGNIFFEGTIRHTDEYGNLVIESNGKLKTFRNGEIIFLERMM